MQKIPRWRREREVAGRRCSKEVSSLDRETFTKWLLDVVYREGVDGS